MYYARTSFHFFLEAFNIHSFTDHAVGASDFDVLSLCSIPQLE